LTNYLHSTSNFNTSYFYNSNKDIPVILGLILSVGIKYYCNFYLSIFYLSKNPYNIVICGVYEYPKSSVLSLYISSLVGTNTFNNLSQCLIYSYNSKHPLSGLFYLSFYYYTFCY